MDEKNFERAIADFESGKTLSETVSKYPAHAEEIAALFASLSALKPEGVEAPDKAAFSRLLKEIPGDAPVALGWQWSVFLKAGLPALVLVFIVSAAFRHPAEAPQEGGVEMVPEAATFQRTMLYDGSGEGYDAANSAPSLMMQKSAPATMMATDTAATSTDEAPQETDPSK
jgi:hypothetical protein